MVLWFKTFNRFAPFNRRVAPLRSKRLERIERFERLERERSDSNTVSLAHRAGQVDGPSNIKYH
jgi:hypothetical protein